MSGGSCDGSEDELSIGCLSDVSGNGDPSFDLLSSATSELDSDSVTKTPRSRLFSFQDTPATFSFTIGPKGRLIKSQANPKPKMSESEIANKQFLSFTVLFFGGDSVAAAACVARFKAFLPTDPLRYGILEPFIHCRVPMTAYMCRRGIIWEPGKSGGQWRLES
jgi:hypothetical protein